MVRGVEDVAPRYKHYNLNLITIAKNSLKVFEGVKGGNDKQDKKNPTIGWG